MPLHQTWESYEKTNKQREDATWKQTNNHLQLPVVQLTTEQANVFFKGFHFDCNSELFSCFPFEGPEACAESRRTLTRGARYPSENSHGDHFVQCEKSESKYMTAEAAHGKTSFKLLLQYKAEMA